MQVKHGETQRIHILVMMFGYSPKVHVFTHEVFYKYPELQDLHKEALIHVKHGLIQVLH
jgi:hypothetical protein